MQKSIRQIFILNLLYGSLMIFSTIIPAQCTALVSLFIYVYSYTIVKKQTNTTTALLTNSILFLPVSFVSIIGTDYGKLPITWFAISILLLLVIAIWENRLKKTYLVLYILFTLFFVISLFSSSTTFSAMSQFFTISLCLFSFQIGEYLKNKSDDKITDFLQDCYILSTITSAFQIIIQRIWISNTGQVIGHYAVMGGNRFAYSGLMGDYSFASLYIATGALLLVLLYLVKKKSIINIIAPLLLLVMASILVSARTGIFSLVIATVMAILYYSKKNIARVLLICAVGVLLLPIAINYMLSVRNMDNYLDGSGRVELISQAWDIFLDHPLFGIGFGIENIKNNYNMVVPHNFFIQYLLQFGIIGLGILLPNFILFYNINKKNNYIMWLFIICVIGAMLIPDITSSRFLTIIIIMATINRTKKEIYEHE